ncbi:MAG: hypothetical protein V1678_02260 [Candidatus Aenigmatarchaeota archaeon]
MANSSKPEGTAEIYNNLFRAMKWMYAGRLDDNANMILVRRENDYVVATSKGEEIPLPYETADKVRDIMAGNMTGLTEYEEKFFDRFKEEGFLRTLAEDSAKRYQKEIGGKPQAYAADLLLSQILNPQFLSSLRVDFETSAAEKEAECKKEIDAFVQKNFGVKVDVNQNTLKNILIKLSSDHAYERKKFMKDALKKRR